MQEIEINPAKLKTAKIMAMDDTLFYTRYFFKHQYKRKFVVNSHHNQVCAVLDKVYQGQLVKVIINIAPRYSKTELAVKNFISKGLALNPASKYIHLSYSDDLALDNSEGIKDIVNLPEYQLMFPDVKIKQGSDSKKKWYTSKGGGVYATSTAGQVTGFGAGRVDDEEQELNSFFDDIQAAQDFNGALVVDDPIKPEDAMSDLRRERINERWTTTIQNRVNSRKTPMIVMGQRTHPRDLCGFLMETDGFTTDINEAINNPHLWYVLSIPAILTDANGLEYALWDFKHTLPELKRMERADPHMFGTQYMQNPQPKEGLMYAAFSEYDVIPASKVMRKKAYVDTADLGTDYLFSGVYLETETAMYMIDVIYTQSGMETTEPLTGMQFTKHGVEIAEIESNNGGRGFARNVETQCRLLGNTKTTIHWFHQSKNKEVRIFNKSADVTNMILMPRGWQYLWPEFYKAVTSYSKTGKNAHDDAPDGLTGMVENFGKGGGAKFGFGKK